MRILQDAETSIPLVSLRQIFTEKKKINKWYQSQSVNTLNFSKTNLSFLKNQRMVPISIPTEFTQSVNRKYTIRELGLQFSHR